jgi:hypothetical protein
VLREREGREERKRREEERERKRGERKRGERKRVLYYYLFFFLFVCFNNFYKKIKKLECSTCVETQKEFHCECNLS